MSRLLSVFVVGASLVLFAQFIVSGNEPWFGKRPIRIKASRSTEKGTAELCVLGGELRFVSFWVNGRSPTKPGAPPLPGYAMRFVRDGAHIRVLLQKDQPSRSKEVAAKDGWYVTGDYSTKPPSVILTKEPTKYSRWEFVSPRPGGRIYQTCFLKNENDLGTDAWLSMENEGTTYQGGIAHAPILAVEKRELSVLEADEGK